MTESKGPDIPRELRAAPGKLLTAGGGAGSLGVTEAVHPFHPLNALAGALML